MAKFKKALPFVILALISVLVFAFLAAPMVTVKYDGDTIAEGKEISVYEYLQDSKDQMKEARKAVQEAEDLGLGDTAFAKKIKQGIAIYDTFIAILALAAVCLAVSLAALALSFLKKFPNVVNTILAILAIALMIAIFICACINIADMNAVSDFAESVTTIPVASILVLVFSLLASLGSGALYAIASKGKKK